MNPLRLLRDLAARFLSGMNSKGGVGNRTKIRLNLEELERRDLPSTGPAVSVIASSPTAIEPAAGKRQATTASSTSIAMAPLSRR